MLTHISISCIKVYNLPLSLLIFDYFSSWGIIGGSGSILLHAEDMMKWMECHLSYGLNRNNERVIPRNVLEYTYRSVTILPVCEMFIRVIRCNNYYFITVDRVSFQSLPLTPYIVLQFPQSCMTLETSLDPDGEEVRIEDISRCFTPAPVGGMLRFSHSYMTVK